MNIKRKITNTVNVGGVLIGGNNPIVIQSMTNTDTRDIKKTVQQIIALEKAGCQIVRVAVPDMEAADAIKEIKRKINIPLAADIHFNYKLALRSMENGIDKLRINPGNIGSIDKTKIVVKMAMQKNIPIRIGVNAGSLNKDILEKYGGVTAEALLESALLHSKIVTNLNYNNIVLSLKSSSVPLTIEAYKLASKKTDFPLHVGVTESGTVFGGSIKSAVGIGSILSLGIGDTIRVSLTGDPVEEIYCAKEILKSLGLRKFGIEFISCPTCGRTQIDLITIASTVEKLCKDINKNITVAVMGCSVNGPGEARQADIGIAAGKGFGVIFKKGEIICKVKESELINTLMDEIQKL